MALAHGGKGRSCCADDKQCKAAPHGKKKPAAGSMYQITVSQSGGIAGINKSFSVDSSKLKKPEQKKLADLVDATGIMKIDSVENRTPGAADMFIYAFEVSCCGKTHKASFDEGVMPASFKALRDYLNTVKQ